ncbi:MAG: FtsQ-type POTRA domain-containing protein, partial [Inquilinus sp.]|nr:FtsQ-type POTRA domain-containing protein [Inquilinus sp.]
NRTGRDELLAALAIEPGSPILSFDPERAREAVVALRWVRNVVVERRFPDTLFLRIEERQPLALWQSEQKLRVIDGDGVVLAEDGLQAYGALPLVVGEAAPEYAAPFLASLGRVPAVADRVEAAILVSGRRWDLRLDSGIDVRLPEDGLDAALQRLSELEAKSGLFDRDILAIDLRLEDRLAVQVTPAANERRRLPGEDT